MCWWIPSRLWIVVSPWTFLAARESGVATPNIRWPQLISSPATTKRTTAQPSRNVLRHRPRSHPTRNTIDAPRKNAACRYSRKPSSTVRLSPRVVEDVEVERHSGRGKDHEVDAEDDPSSRCHRPRRTGHTGGSTRQRTLRVTHDRTRVNARLRTTPPWARGGSSSTTEADHRLRERSPTVACGPGRGRRRSNHPGNSQAPVPQA